MLSERTIINGLILIAGLILGPYLISLTFELNQLALLSFAGFVFFFAVFFFIKDRVACFPYLATSFSGNLNFLPFGLGPVEIFSLMTILYYLVNYVALKRRPVEAGPRYILFPMVVVGAIVLYHNHKLSFGALGGSEEGSRPGLVVLIAIAAYLCGINIPCPSAKFISRIPIWCFLAGTIGSFPFLLTTYFPSLAPYVYYVSGNVNIDAYVDSLSGGDASDLSRNGALLQLSGGLEGVLLAYYPISTWWRPSRWFCILISIFNLFGILSGGYRNSLFTFMITFLLAGICYSRWRVLLMLPLFSLPILALILVQNNHFGDLHLPTTVQRSMSFLPGNWDPDVIASAESSNDFRAEIKKIYIKEYMSKSPWVGNGFAFDAGEAEGLEAMADVQKGSDDKAYFLTKAFLVSKNFHVGWISLYDAVGIIGSAGFIMLNISLICLSAFFVFQSNADMSAPLYPLKVWLFCSQVASFVGYFATFGSFAGSLVSLCSTSIIMVYLRKLDQREEFKTVSPSPRLSLGAAHPLATSSPAKLSLR